MKAKRMLLLCGIMGVLLLTAAVFLFVAPLAEPADLETEDYPEDLLIEDRSDPAADAEEVGVDPATLERQKEGLKTMTVGGNVFFGVYEQDDDSENGPEEIEWMVLDQDGSRYLLLSRYVLDKQPYYRTNTDTVVWESSYARTWLNGDFLHTAFPAEEQALIPEVTVLNPGNTLHNVPGGEDTVDRCFLLSAEEIDQYLPTNELRQAEYTKVVDRLDRYHHAEGIYAAYAKNEPWTIRTPGESAEYANCISIFGDDPYIKDYTLEEIIEEINNDESLSEAQKQEEIAGFRSGKYEKHRFTGILPKEPVGMRPALWVDISGLE